MPQRGGGIAGLLNETRWFYAPTGRKGIAQGKAKRRPGIRYETTFASPERAEPEARKSMRTCFALSGLWRIRAAAYPGRWCTQVAIAPRVALRSTLGYLIMPRWGGGMVIHRTRSDGLLPQRDGRDRWFIERSPTVLCPNGAQGDSPGQSEAPPWDSVRNNFR
jgi:hypothetical protein